MDKEFFQNRIHLGAIAFFFFGLFVLAFGFGLFAFGAKGETESDIQIISASSTPGLVSEIMVDVDGAVVSPGLYRLNRDSRLNDAIEAAGGMSSNADRARINLASKLVDGQKIHIFAQGENAAASGVVSGEKTSGLVSVNSGSQAELEELPGIGPVTAQKIIASRPYSSLEDLKVKKAVSASVYEKIKDLIVL